MSKYVIMDINYLNGKMRITHPSGVVTIYDREESLLQKKRIELDIADAQKELQYFDNILKQLTASIPKEPLVKRILKVFSRKQKGTVK